MPAPSPDHLDPETYERTHVHSVYEAIAPHFSATRYKPWPVVADFLRAQPRGAIGLDVGCGNGKYLDVNPDVFLVGSDRSAALVALARGKHGQQNLEAEGPGQDQSPSKEGGGAAMLTSAAGTEVVVADGLSLPFRPRAADFVICVAVIHHLSTRQRRQEAVRHLLDCVKTPGPHEPDGGGRVLVYVWALEQGTSRRGWQQGGDQDLLVPWVMKSQQPRRPRRKGGSATEEDKSGESQEPPEASEKRGEDQTFQRYYHLYREGELEEDVRAVGGRVVGSGYDRDNWWAIAADAS